MVLPFRERTPPAEELDQDPPRHRGQMHPRQLRPLQHREAAEEDEGDEGEVEDGDRDRCEVVHHAFHWVRRAEV
jgi:hypothetical protein